MIIKPGQLEHQDELQHLKQLTHFVYVFLDKIQLETIQNVHESILRHLEAVIKAKGGKTPSEILLIILSNPYICLITCESYFVILFQQSGGTGKLHNFRMYSFFCYSKESSDRLEAQPS